MGQEDQPDLDLPARLAIPIHRYRTFLLVLHNWPRIASFTWHCAVVQEIASSILLHGGLQLRLGDLSLTGRIISSARQAIPSAVNTFPSASTLNTLTLPQQFDHLFAFFSTHIQEPLLLIFCPTAATPTSTPLFKIYIQSEPYMHLGLLWVILVLYISYG